MGMFMDIFRNKYWLVSLLSIGLLGYFFYGVSIIYLLAMIIFAVAALPAIFRVVLNLFNMVFVSFVFIVGVFSFIAIILWIF